MKSLFKLLIPVGFALIAGCVVVPAGPPRAYVGARVGFVAPAPVVVVRPWRY